MASVRIWQKNEIHLDRLSIKQNQMFKIGTVGVAAVKKRVKAGEGPNDAPANPPPRWNTIQKTGREKGNRRNLILTGDMLRNFQVRTVSENRAVARATGRSTTKTTTNKRGKAV